MIPEIDTVFTPELTLLVAIGALTWGILDDTLERRRKRREGDKAEEEKIIKMISSTSPPSSPPPRDSEMKKKKKKKKVPYKITKRYPDTPGLN